MEACVFCGSTSRNLTKEHVIPKWARKAFDIRGGVTIHALDDPPADRALVGRLPDLNIVLNDRICATCNNEWLAELERKVRPLLEPMAVSITPTMIDSAAQQLLAFWAVKTCLLLELAFRQRYPGSRLVEGYQATPQELAWLRARDEPPPCSMVWLGCWGCQKEMAVNYEPAGAELQTSERRLGYRSFHHLHPQIRRVSGVHRRLRRRRAARCPELELESSGVSSGGATSHLASAVRGAACGLATASVPL